MDTSQDKPLDNAMEQQAVEAFRSECFPCNPRPFAKVLGEIVAREGTDAIKSDRAKTVLWILMAQAYGQLAVIDMHDEWCRLERLPKEMPITKEVV